MSSSILLIYKTFYIFNSFFFLVHEKKLFFEQNWCDKYNVKSVIVQQVNGENTISFF